MNDIYFFDTYAIIEIIKGNSNYLKYKNARIVTTIFNLVELHYAILKDFNKIIADEILEKYVGCVVNIDLDIIKEASEFKLKNKQKKLSATDSIGYIFSIKKGIRFLTGDEGFRDLDNVEFVK